jgi:hypothetical protein
MDKETEQLIRERAYVLWENEGRPEGGAEQYWRRAEEEIMNKSLDDRANLAIERAHQAVARTREVIAESERILEESRHLTDRADEKPSGSK